jgi:multidrug efflux pump subunit AcrA (membrane-fusion protein)
MRAVLVRVPPRALFALALAAAVGIGTTLLWRLGSNGAAAQPFTLVRANRGDVAVTVGGVGRIVLSQASADIVLPSATGRGGPASGSSAGNTASAPGDAVFPRATGHLSRFVVVPGDHVAAAQPVALVDDGGVAAAAAAQARYDLAIALLELRQKHTSDPLRGLPPTRAELAAGRVAVVSARRKLGRLLGPPLRADVTAAQLDVKRAESDLATLLGGSPAARAQVIELARKNVEVAQARLDRILAPPSAADVRAAEGDVTRAEAELAVLRRPAASPLPEAVTAAEQAVTVARQKLADVKADPTATATDVSVAQLELDKAQAELAALLRPAQAPLPEEIAHAQKAVEIARLRLAKLLAPPDPADVSAARLELERAEAELRMLEAGPTPTALAAARQAVVSSRARLEQVLGPPLPSDVTGARLDVRRAVAELAVLRARGGPASAFDVALARLKVDAARARLASARFAEQLLTVRAPAGGTVTSLLTVAGAPVDGTTPIAAVADLDHLAVSVGLSEFDAAQVKTGLAATVKVDALGGKAFSAKVGFTALTGVDSGGGVVTFPVQVTLGRSGGLKPGMNVSVRIVVAERSDVVELPLEAVSRNDEDRPLVTVMGATGKTTTRPVTLGLANNKSVEIVRGLRAGERVVLAQSEGGEGD